MCRNPRSFLQKSFDNGDVDHRPDFNDIESSPSSPVIFDPTSFLFDDRYSCFTIDIDKEWHRLGLSIPLEVLNLLKSCTRTINPIGLSPRRPRRLNLRRGIVNLLVCLVVGTCSRRHVDHGSGRSLGWLEEDSVKM